jgi:hypothetical protein
MELVVNPTSAILIEAMKTHIPQSLLLSGEDGVGLNTIAAAIASAHTKHPITIQPEKDEKIDLEKGVVGVDIIRRLYDQTRSKQTADQVFVINYADRMTRQAQNAFLKLLEEPTIATHFILVAHQPSNLLPTIHSRAQEIVIQRTTTEQSQRFIDALGVTDATKRTQLLFMAEGRPAELWRLVHDDTYFNQRAAMIRDARTLIQGAPYDRLLVAQAYRDDRQAALSLLDDAIAMARRTLSQKLQPELVTYLDQLMNTYQRIEANGNIRLCLAALMV